MTETYCQSCGMPMHGDELHGTQADGSKTGDYCIYCYENGSYKNPGQTLEEMINECVPFMTEKGMPEQEARALLQQQLPHLKRWRTEA
ncbi:zinc ribbon domain-containing protein [Gorillibacterium sp. sgz5001074]|uniref:zinc ribbon domain-containing protein n=1 Tax=Gorillibacterium sp. sgz5001074 TaxID=3446695 RepID=UPI003F67DE98